MNSGHEKPTRALVALKNRVRVSLGRVPLQRLHPHYIAQEVHIQMDKVLECAQMLLDRSADTADALTSTISSSTVHPLVTACPEAVQHAVDHFHAHLRATWKPLIDEGAVYLVDRTRHSTFYPHKWHHARKRLALSFLLQALRAEICDNLHLLAWTRANFGIDAPFLDLWWHRALTSIRSLDNWTVLLSQQDDASTTSLLQHPLLPHPVFFVTVVRAGGDDRTYAAVTRSTATHTANDALRAFLCLPQ